MVKWAAFIEKIECTLLLNSTTRSSTPQRVSTRLFYEVEPQGILEDDPDCRAPGRSYACEKAKIIAIHKVRGKSIKKARKKMLQAKSQKRYIVQE
jgi:hypothetical protein